VTVNQRLLLATASELSVRLWTIQGQFLCVFGQPSQWTHLGVLETAPLVAKRKTSLPKSGGPTAKSARAMMVRLIPRLLDQAIIKQTSSKHSENVKQIWSMHNTPFTRSNWLDELLYVSWTSQLDVCSTFAQLLLEVCSMLARRLLDVCSTFARCLLDVCPMFAWWLLCLGYALCMLHIYSMFARLCKRGIKHGLHEAIVKKRRANIEQTSSKHQAIRAHVVHVHFEYICLMVVWCLLDRVNGVLGTARYVKIFFFCTPDSLLPVGSWIVVVIDQTEGPTDQNDVWRPMFCRWIDCFCCMWVKYNGPRVWNSLLASGQTDGRTDGRTELRWLRRAESIAAFARKK